MKYFLAALFGQSIFLASTFARSVGAKEENYNRRLRRSRSEVLSQAKERNSAGPDGSDFTNSELGTRYFTVSWPYYFGRGSHISFNDAVVVGFAEVPVQGSRANIRRELTSRRLATSISSYAMCYDSTECWPLGRDEIFVLGSRDEENRKDTLSLTFEYRGSTHEDFYVGCPRARQTIEATVTGCVLPNSEELCSVCKSDNYCSGSSYDMSILLKEEHGNVAQVTAGYYQPRNALVAHISVVCTELDIPEEFPAPIVTEQ